MKPSSPPRVPCWLLEFILPGPYRREMLGDLIEEYNLRTNSTSVLESSLWFWSQTCRSVPSLIWSLLRNGDWLPRLMVAFSVYIAMAILRFSAGTAISKLIAPGETTRVVLAPVVFLVTTAIDWGLRSCENSARCNRFPGLDGTGFRCGPDRDQDLHHTSAVVVPGWILDTRPRLGADRAGCGLVGETSR